MNRKEKMKTIAGAGSFALFSLLPAAAFAAVTPVLLEPSLAPGGAKTVSDPGAYLVNLYKIGIGIAGALAVVMIVYGGIEYIMASVSPSQKEAARKRIASAIGGLILLLSSYLILKTINPDLVNFNLNFGAASPRTDVPPGTGANALREGEASSELPTAGSPSLESQFILSDETTRETLGKEGVEFNKDCIGGDTGTCMNIRLSTAEEITFLQRLLKEGGSKENVKINGGSEIFTLQGDQQVPVHELIGDATHADGYKFDAALGSDLTKMIENRRDIFVPKGKRGDGAQIYLNTKTGAIYAKEKTHWDVKVF